MEQVDVALARWAVAEGSAVVEEATAALASGEDVLAIATRLRRTHAPDRAAFALTAATARRRAIADGVPGAERLVLTSEAAAQASHPAVAAWRASAVVEEWRRVGAPGRIVDLCGGTGADATAIAAAGAPVVAVERDPGRAVLLAHRASVLGVDVEVVVGDALAPPVALAGAVVHADPDRRDGRGRRARSLASHGPPVGALLRVAADAGSSACFVTVAPGVAWDDPDLPEDVGVSFVEVGGDLVEAVLATAGEHRARAVDLSSGLVRAGVGDGDRRLLPVGPVGSHLLVPAVSLVRARLHDEVGAGHGARRLARRRSLLTADRAVEDPWLRCERVVATVPARPAGLRAWLHGGAEETSRARRGVEVLVHGLDVDPTTFLCAAGAPTGPHGVRLHLVRRDEDAVGIVTVASAHGS